MRSSYGPTDGARRGQVDREAGRRNGPAPGKECRADFTVDAEDPEWAVAIARLAIRPNCAAAATPTPFSKTFGEAGVGALAKVLATGPRTAEGKTRASRNGDKGAKSRAERDEVKAIRQLMRELLEEQREVLQRL